MAARYFSQAKAGRRVLAGPEAHTRIEDDFNLSAPWTAAAPTWADAQCVANFQRFEMTLPCLRPVFGAQLFECDSCRRILRVELQLPQFLGQSRASGPGPFRLAM